MAPHTDIALAKRTRLFSTKIDVRWGDMDAIGHVNNTEYFRYMEHARINWFNSIGVRLAQNNQGPILVAASCTFLKPIVYPATVAVSVDTGQPGRSSFPVDHTIWLESDPSVKFAECQTTLVWVDYATGNSIPLPDEMRKLLGG